MAVNAEFRFISIFVVLFLQGLSLAKSQWVLPDEVCRTPQKEVGSCIPIMQCKPMLDFLSSSSSQNAQLPQTIIDLLQGFQCGYEGDTVKVCCPDGPINIANPDTKGPPLPPDVSNHKNLNLLPAECGLQNSKTRIIGGNKTALFEFPWMALLSYDIGGSGVDFKCAGTVINKWYILTAAHCITHLTGLKLIGVRVGEYNISSPTDCEQEPFGDEYCAPPVQDIRVAETIPHPGYNPTSYIYDIGLIRVGSPINTDVESVKPICLPITSDLRNKNFLGTKLTVTGWGVTETAVRSPDLLKVDIPVISEVECKKPYEKTKAIINHTQMCAGGQNKTDSCAGDSGGPLQTNLFHSGDVRFLQFGIVSFGPRRCGQEGFPGVYTRVDYYMDWVLDNMKP